MLLIFMATKYQVDFGIFVSTDSPILPKTSLKDSTICMLEILNYFWCIDFSSK